MRSSKTIRRIGYINDLEESLGFDSSEPHTMERHKKLDTKLREMTVELLKNRFKSKSNEKILQSFELDLQTTYMNWRTGIRPISKKSRPVFKLLFPELEDKWFGNSPHKNRVGLYLDSIDLIESYLMGNELSAITSATDILSKLLIDWTPISNDQKNIRLDLFIPGPKLKPDNLIEGFNLRSEDNKFTEFELPKEVVSLINQRTPETCTSYLYFLVGGGYKGDIDFRTDLTIDFLTSLNCGLLLYVHSQTHEDKTYNRRDKMFGGYIEQIIHFFYDSTGYTDYFLDYKHLRNQTLEAIQIHKSKNITPAGIRARKDSHHAVATLKRDAITESTYAWRHVIRTTVFYDQKNAFNQFVEDHKKATSRENPKLFRGYRSYHNAISNSLFDSKNRFQASIGLSNNSKFSELFSQHVNPLFGLLMEYNLINSQTKDKLNLKSTIDKVKRLSIK